MVDFQAACGQIREVQPRFNKLFGSREDVRPEWYLTWYGGLKWEELYLRVCKELRLQPLGKK